MPSCPNCGAEVAPGSNFCTKCGNRIIAEVAKMPSSDIIMVTSPNVPGYRVKKILGIVTGLTARTRGVGGKIVAGIQSIVGGEVSAFTYEIEKARKEALQRMEKRARELGANAIISVDVETS
ncbi:heavy metal-binding domain-containing protein, partial [Candidatus Bathyarchaeota archaeon]|nr:heavy metal-binding domain-containing protein [Candidatus Bathyarchaeota archaeon]